MVRQEGLEAVPSSDQFLLDKTGQAAQGFKSLGADLIIIHRDAEMILERGDDVDHSHGVQFRNVSQQDRIRLELVFSLSEA